MSDALAILNKSLTGNEMHRYYDIVHPMPENKETASEIKSKFACLQRVE